MHKSWGFGRVESLNFLINQITIDFKTRKGHTMQLQYAAESLTVISAEHILAQKAANLAAVKARTKEDPAGLVRTILHGFGGKAHAGADREHSGSGCLLRDGIQEVARRREEGAQERRHFAIPRKKVCRLNCARAQSLTPTNTSPRSITPGKSSIRFAALDLIVKNRRRISGAARTASARHHSDQRHREEKRAAAHGRRVKPSARPR
jgi:hypothetical protein